MFFDEVKVQLQAGHGGEGCMSFRREKYVPKGGPDGGDGGRGGHVILRGDENTGDLRKYHFKPGWKAERGLYGMGRQRHGRNGEDLILDLPLGTVIYSEETGEAVAEITSHEQEILLLKGGRGGLGNIHYKSATNQTPRKSTPGADGETGAFKLVLKTIADFGLIGYPNAGKSTLLGQLSEAEPKTGNYPFTTIHPTVGVVECADTFRRVKVADIPGLIEGAHENRGLGHRFLRHVERCEALIFLIDAAGVDQRDPVEDYRILLEEIRAYDSKLLDRPRILVANKVDLPEAAEHLSRLEDEAGDSPFLALSAQEQTGMEALSRWLFSVGQSIADR